MLIRSRLSYAVPLHAHNFAELRHRTAAPFDFLATAWSLKD